MKSILEEFEREDLPNNGLQLLSDAIGINNVKLMLLKCPGQTFHVPKTFWKQSDMNYIQKHKDDKPADIATELGCSLSTAYRKLRAIQEPY